MASAFKPMYLQPIPPNATRCKIKGDPAVRYIDGKDKAQVRPIRLDASGNATTMMVCEQSCWWMKYTLPDGTVRREKGYRDKLSTEQEAARREREGQQAAAGLQLVDSKHLSAPLTAHVAAFVADLERCGRAPKHYELLDMRLRAIATACGWDTLGKIGPDSMGRYLATLRTAGKAPKTQNEYLAAARGFCNWCVNTRRLAGNPLASVKATENVEKTYQRRALSAEEAMRLVAAAGSRRLVYLLAIYSGLRRSEMRQLQWGDLRIGQDAKTPYIALRASTTKARRADRLPLREDLAADLRAAMPADAQPTDHVFASMPKMDTFKRDLAKAGIAHIDSSGRVVDLHSLRYTCGTMLAKAGVAPRVAMEIMRHTDMRLTMNLYTDPSILNTSAAVDSMPRLDGKPEHAQAKAAALKTGTDGIPVQMPDGVIALNRVPECPEGSISVHFGDSGNAKTPIKQGVLHGGGGNRTRVP